MFCSLSTTSAIVIIRLMLSLWLRTKAITLSGFHCMSKVIWDIGHLEICIIIINRSSYIIQFQHKVVDSGRKGVWPLGCAGGLERARARVREPKSAGATLWYESGDNWRVREQPYVAVQCSCFWLVDLLCARCGLLLTHAGKWSRSDRGPADCIMK